MQRQRAWTVDRIQKLRGSESRADFARRLGVTPLTAYRWELPDGAPEARRPRGAVARRLLELEGSRTERHAAGGRGSAERETRVSSPRAPDPEGLLELLPTLARLEVGELERAELELIAALTSSRSRDEGNRVLATQALARCQLWRRGDAVGALVTLLPILPLLDTGALWPTVELEVHVTAALVFASFDGRVFDPGKVNIHAARAEALLDVSTDAQRFLLWWSQLVAAFILNDPALIERALERRRDLNLELSSPVLRLLAVEARLVEHYFARRPDSAARDFEELLSLSAPFPMFHVRALAQAARNAIDEGAPATQVLDLVARARSLSERHRVVPGLPALYLAYAEGEALFRSGRLAAAEEVWRTGLALGGEMNWPTGTLSFFLVRSYLASGRGERVRELAAAAPESVVEPYLGVHRALRRALFALAEIAEGHEVEAAVDALDEAVCELERHNVWSFLRRSMVLVSAVASLLAGTPQQADRALRQADRVLDAVPSAYGQAAVRWLRGVSAFRRGDLATARLLLDGARARFEAAEDRVLIALSARLLALMDQALGESDAEAALEETARTLAELGLASLGALERHEPPARASAPEAPPEGAIDLRTLGELIDRLTTRGSPRPAIEHAARRGLETLFPGTVATLEPVGPRAESGPDTGAAVEFGDGTGLRFRLGLSGLAPRSAATEVSRIVARVTGLALEVSALRGDSAAPEGGLPAEGEAPEIPGLIAASPAMRRIKLDLTRLARSRSTIIVTGESGVGKEVVARALHDLSVRAHRPYVAFNCAAIPRELFEGQLFGYRKGAFTGANSDQPGVIRAAEGGTLFLDEIGELPLELQPKLLRFLENGEVFPLGSERPVSVDVRVVAATLRDLGQLVREGRFREDLYYRLQVVPLHIPPLRERPADVVALARYFIDRMTPEGSEAPVLAPDANLALSRHAWPGNVRELRNVIERSLAFEPWPRVLRAVDLRLVEARVAAPD